MKAIISGMRRGRKYTEQKIIRADESLLNTEMNIVSVYPQVRCQQIRGFGGAFTDAAGYVYSLMDEQDRADVIRTYFDPSEMGYTWGRTSIDSCDFSTEMDAAANDPADTAREQGD